MNGSTKVPTDVNCKLLEEYEAEEQISDSKTTYREPKTVSWINITAKAIIRQRGCKLSACCGGQRDQVTKTILRNVNGIAKAQSFLAIIGSSGSGKTTLLNCLLNRNLGSLKVDGRILVNGKDVGDNISRISGYAQQDDIFSCSMTVKEHLWFNAVLRLDRNLLDNERQERVDRVIRQMGLETCKNSTIGFPGTQKSISGGEKRRLAFATELITKPFIMFCDEPTTGLDSFMARSVVQALKDMAEDGHTVIATIHQPSSEVFSMFDEILIMAEGKVAFLGPKNDAVTFFSGLGFCCPLSYNPADFLINALAITPGNEEVCREKIKTICRRYEESTHSRAVKDANEQLENMAQDTILLKKEKLNEELAQKGKHEARWRTQFRMCFWRSFIDVKRNKDRIQAKCVHLLVLSLLLGAIYWKQPYTLTGSQNIDAAMFMIITQIAYNLTSVTMAGSSISFPGLVKEYHDRQYSVSAFYLAGLLTEIPFSLLVILLYMLTSYWMIGLYPTAGAFLMITAATALMSLNTMAYGHLCASLFQEQQLALVVLPFLVCMQILFSGYVIAPGSTPKIFRIFEDLSSFRYGYEVLIICQWEDVKYIDCNLKYDFSTDTINPEKGICYQTGLEHIESYGYNVENLGYCFLILVVLWFAVELVGFIGLVFNVKHSK